MYIGPKPNRGTKRVSLLGPETEDQHTIACPYCGKRMVSCADDSADWHCKHCGYKAYDQEIDSDG